MMNRDFFPDTTEGFDASVRRTLAALPEKKRRRMTAGKVAAIALAAALCLGGTALAASGGLFPLLFPGDGGEAVGGYVQQPAEPVAENADWRLTVDSVLFDSSSRTGIVSLRLENLKGDGKMPFKVAKLLPEYRDQPNVSWTALASTYANADGECWFDVLNAAGTSAFTGEYYLDTQRSTENVYYLEAALIAYEDYSAGDALTLGMYQHGKDAAVLSVDIPEPQALPSVSSGDGAVTLSQVGLRVELATAEVAVDAIDYVALRMADGSELVIIDKANSVDRTLYALGTASDPSEGSTENVATYLLAAAPELENVRSVVINDIEYQLS